MPVIQVPGYEIFEKISDGAMGIVYKARQQSLNRVVAIKVLREELLSDPSAVAQFRLEANSVANLKHPNILQVYEAGEINGVPYFVMEYVAAYSVADWLSRKGVLAERDTLTIADTVARALQYAWDKAGLIHCDLKPGNILVDDDGSVKVADFSGISRSNISAEAQLLRDVTIGTPNYMSPEQVRGLADIDCRVDIYSLGAVMYHLVTGVLPFEHCTDQEAMRQHLEGTLTDPAEVNPSVSANFSMLVEKMMVKDRDQRPNNWEAVLADLERVQAGLPPLPPLAYPGSSTIRRTAQPKVAAPVVRPKPPPVFSPPQAPPAPLPTTLPHRRRPVLWALSGVAALLFALDLFLFLWPGSPLRRPTPRPPAAAKPPPPEPAPAPAPSPITSPTTHPPAVAPAPRPPRPPRPVPPATAEVTVVATQTSPPPPTAEASAATTTAVAEAAAHPPWPEYREYLKLMQEVITDCARRNHGGALERLRAWLRDHPAHAMRAQVEREAERIASLQGLFAILADNSRALWGRPIRFTSGVTGTVLAVRGTRVIVSRRLGEGTAETDHDLLRFSQQDILDLLRAADEAHFPLNAARFLLAEGQFAAVEMQLAAAQRISLPTEDLTAWLADWRRIVLNIRADRAVDDVKAKVEARDFDAAAESLAAATPAYRDTDVFQWGRAAEIAALDAAIRTFAKAPTGESLAPVSTPKTARSETPAPDTPADSVDTSDIEQVNVSELTSRLRELDGRVIRLRFRFRGPISETGPGMYVTDLGMDSSTIRVEFSQEGYRWFRNSVGTGFALDQPIRVAYGVVDARRQVVRLLGRTMKRRIGGQDEFFW
ncbi:MAG: serine/threonine protein kinase [Kiritimatiellae bacterium]|nr:serine/threonine protein kinase [Kiritimatiellia bacterium]